MTELCEAELDALMARLADGDRAAFAPLFAALQPRALRLARSHVRGAASEDIAQSALLRVFAHAARFTPGRPVLPWFYAIVANELHAARRKSRASAPLAEGALVAEPGEDPEQALLERELQRALAVALESLDGQAAEAINAVLGRASAPPIAPARLRKRISRAYQRLRILLGELK